MFAFYRAISRWWKRLLKSVEQPSLYLRERYRERKRNTQATISYCLSIYWNIWIKSFVSLLYYFIQELLSAVPSGVRCLPIAADVRNYSAMSDAVDRVLLEFGRIDILVNGAAGNFPCSPESLSYNGFKSVMETGTPFTHSYMFVLVAAPIYLISVCPFDVFPYEAHSITLPHTIPTFAQCWH